MTGFEANDNKSEISIGQRSNRYLDAPVDWGTYPENIVLACRGTQYAYNDFTQANCGTLKRFNDKSIFFVGEDYSGTPKPMLNRCGKLSCNMDGIHIASKRGKNSALRVLAYLKLTNWNQIKFISFNIKDSHTAERLNTDKIRETREEFKERKKKLKIFDFKPDENIYTWLTRTRKIIQKHAIESGLRGNAIIFHSCRLKQIGYPVETRRFDPHFHNICVGKIMEQNKFFRKYGYNYTQQKPIDRRNKESLRSLPRRIAYRLNHSAYAFTKNGNSMQSIAYSGGMGYRSLRIGKKEKNFEYLLTETGAKMVAVKLNATSEQPSNVKRQLMKEKVKKGKLARLMNEQSNFSKILNNSIYQKDLKIDESWKEQDLDFVLNPKTREKMYLVEVEIVKKFIYKNKTCIVSSNDFKKKKSNYCLVFGNSKSNTPNKPISDEKKARIDNRANEIKALRLAKEQLASA